MSSEIAGNALDSGWQDNAACAGLSWEKTHGSESETVSQRNWREKRLIRNYCFSCVVQKECLLDALERHDGFGVRGGTPETARRSYFEGKLATVEAVLQRGKVLVYGRRALEQIIAIPEQRVPLELSQPAEPAA